MFLRHRQNRRGGVLMLCLFVLVMLQILATVFLRMLPVEATAALRSENGNVASLVAESGVTECMAWLKFQLAPPNGSSPKEPLHPSVYPSQAQRTATVGGGWSYRWSLEADPETFPNGNNPTRGYTVKATAYRDGLAMREVKAQILQDSLSRYARFFEIWPSTVVHPVRTTTAPAGGPVHVNDVMRLWVPEGLGYWNSSGTPIFTHGLTSSGVFNANHAGQDGFAYFQGNYSGSDPEKLPYHPTNGPIKERYARMVNGGQQNVRSGLGELPLPKHTFNLRDAAWGFGNANYLPNTDGVYVNTDGMGAVAGGVYIRGVVEELELGYGGSQPAGSGVVNYAGNSWMKIEQPLSGRNSIDAHQCVTVVGVDEAPVTLPAGAVLNGTTLASPVVCQTGTTLVRSYDGTFKSYPGKLNGVVYGTENIQDLWGVNKGRRTITVESDKSQAKYRKIVLGGKESDVDNTFSTNAGEKGILQFGAVDADNDGILDKPSSAANVLGLIGYDVEVSAKLKRNQTWASGHPAGNPLFLYACVLAGMPDVGGGYKVEGYDSGGAGYCYRYGGQVQCEAGAWGTTSGQGFVHGTTAFDEAAAVSPPPYFPTLPTFTVKSYEDTPVMSGERL
jgi:hypothetical protein